ncbi:MAG: MFS transporter [Actinomycetota bacterium]
MAVTEAKPEAGEPTVVPRKSFLAHPALVVAAITGLLLIFAWAFLQDPSRTAATRDPAWYTWRSGVIVESDPGLVAGDWGPFHMFGGGYRVTVPVIGALLDNIADTDQSSFAAFMMILVPILAGLAFAAGAYRSTKSPVLYLLTMLVTGVFFLTTPYVGYLDNLFVLYVLGALISFLEPARKSWGARGAVVLLSILAAYTHPTTCVVFLGTMFVVVGWHVLTMRFNVRAVLDRDIPALASVMGGMIFGLILWPLGKFLLWGTAGNIADAALPPPYTREFFLDRLVEWVKSQYPLVVIPLLLIGVVWIAQTARREKKPADAYRTMVVWWLIPYAASILFVVAGKVLPYYRFMNSTAAIMPLAAIGIWVAGVWLMKKTNRNVIVALLSLLILAFGFRYAVVNGLEASRWNDPENQWIDQPTRVALASVESIAESEPDRPLVFVNNYAQEFQAYGWSKTYANVGRAGLPGAVAPRTFQYFGDLDRFLEGERTITNPSCDKLVGGENEPDLTEVSKRPECTYDLISRGFLDEMNKGVEEHGGEPFVFMVRKFNERSTNLALFDQPDEAMVSLGPDVLLVQGDGYAAPAPQAVDDAIAAGETEADHVKNHPGRFADPMHLARVLLGLIFLFAVPGLIAARWFGIEGWQMKLGLVPPISIGLNIVAAIVVIAVTRSSFGPASAWSSVGLAVVAAAGLNGLAHRREKAGEGRLARGIGGFASRAGVMIDQMSAPFSIKSFRSLMLTQFLSMAGDGVVAGTILTAALNPDDAKTGRDLMALVFLTYLPFAVIAPIVGVLADRFDRRRLLVVANYARAALMVLAVAMLLLGVDSVAILSALALLVLAGFRLTLLIKGAGLPDAVGGKDLLLANSLSQAGGTIFQAGGAIFAVAVGTIFKDLNTGFIAVLAIALYAIAGRFARDIGRLESGTPSGTIGAALRGVLRSVVAGIREVRKRPAAGFGILSFWFTRTLVFGFIGLSISFAAFETLTGAKGAGGGAQTEVIVSVIFAGIGAAIGLFYAQKVKDNRAPAKVVVTFMFLAGGAALLVPFTSAGRYAATFFAGFGFFMVKVAADTVTQQSLPDDFRGRAYALFDITYALSYAIPAAVLFVAASAKVDLDYVVAAYGLVLVLVAAALGAWAGKLGLYRRVSDDLTPQQIATGIGD